MIKRAIVLLPLSVALIFGELRSDDRILNFVELRLLMGRELYESAFVRCSQLLRQYPDQCELYDALAEIGLYSKTLDRTEAVFVDQVRKGIAVGFGLYGLGRVESLIGSHSRAVEFYLEAIRFGCQLPQCYRELVYAYSECYGHEEAISFIGRQRKEWSETPLLNYALGLAHWGRSDFVRARAHLKVAAVADPGCSAILDALAAADLRILYSEEKARIVEARVRLARARGDFAGAYFLNVMLISEQSTAGALKQDLVVLNGLLREAEKYGMLRWVAWAYQRMADAVLLQGQHQRCIEFATKARKTAEIIGEIEVVQGSMDRLYQSYLGLGRLDSALVFAERSLGTGGGSRRKARDLSKHAEIFGLLRESDLAEEYAVASLVESQQGGAEGIHLAEIEMTFAAVEEELGHLDIAFSHSLAAREALQNVTNAPAWQSTNYGSLARIATRIGRMREALGYLRAQRRAIGQTGSGFDRASYWENFGGYWVVKGRADSAEACFKKAILECRRMGHRQAEHGLLGKLAIIRMGANDLEGARSLFERMEVIEQTLDGQGSQIDLRGATWYRKRAVLFARMGRSFECLESISKTRDVEAFHECGAPLRALSKGLEGRDKKELQMAFARWIEASEGVSTYPESPLELQREWAGRIERMKEAAKRKLELRSFGKKSSSTWEQGDELTASPLWMKLGRVQAELARHSAAIIQYCVCDAGVVSVLVTSDSIEADLIPVHILELRGMVDSLSRVTRTSGPPIPILHPLMASFNEGISFRLYKILIERVRSRLRGVNRLIVIPDGILRYLPFDALVQSPAGLDRKPNYLASSFIISYALSPFQLLEPLETNRHNGILIFGAGLGIPHPATPHLSSTDRRLNPETDAPYGVLPEVEVESQYLADLFGSKSVLVQGGDATREKFVSLAPMYGIVHVATHGVIETRGTDRVGLTFSSHSDEFSRSFLHLREVYGMELKAALVFLNGCNSAKPSSVGAGASLVIAFGASGARSVIGSMWEMDDRTARELASTTYRKWLEGRDISEALHEAKEAAIQRGLEDPFRWANLALWGNPWLKSSEIGIDRRLSDGNGDHLNTLPWMLLGIPAAWTILWLSVRKSQQRSCRT